MKSYGKMMPAPNVSIICTTFNEEVTITYLLESLRSQTLAPLEIIICDGKSTDNTVRIITKYRQRYPQAKIKLISKKGNRSIGRNAAIQAASAPLIAITDAGCIPEKNWLKELVAAYTLSAAPVVAGYYKGLPRTAFEEAVVPYALVMPDRINPEIFLPATRSMLIEKKVWQQLGGFDPYLSHNEDYAFAKKIISKGIKISFAKNAVVGWLPRSSLKEFWVMIERFAMGDVEAGLIRPKVVLIFLRYLVLLGMVGLMLLSGTVSQLVALLLVLLVLYSGWSVHKNIRYTPRGWYWLPVLQLVSDMAVMKGSLKGIRRAN